LISLDEDAASEFDFAIAIAIICLKRPWRRVKEQFLALFPAALPLRIVDLLRIMGRVTEWPKGARRLRRCLDRRAQRTVLAETWSRRSSTRPWTSRACHQR
jgi:hypothetical protein